MWVNFCGRLITERFVGFNLGQYNTLCIGLDRAGSKEDKAIGSVPSYIRLSLGKTSLDKPGLTIV